MKTNFLLIVLLVFGWLFMTGKIPAVNRMWRNLAGAPINVKLNELHPAAGSGAPAAVRRLGQGISGSYEHAAPQQ